MVGPYSRSQRFTLRTPLCGPILVWFTRNLRPSEDRTGAQASVRAARSIAADQGWQLRHLPELGL